MNEKAHRLLRPVLSVFILIIVAFISFGGSVSADTEDTQLVLRATLTPESSILYTEIKDLLLLDSFDPGTRTFGIGSNIQTGRFTNKQFGAYRLYAYHNAPLYVAVITDGGIYVYGGKKAEETRALYEELLKYTK